MVGDTVVSMRVIDWEEYILGIGSQGSGIRGCCSDYDIASELHPNSSNSDPHSPFPIPHSLIYILPS